MASPENQPGPENTEKEKEKEEKEDQSKVDDLEETLHGGAAVGPVSRVVGHRIVASAVKPYFHGTAVAAWRWQDGPRGFPNTFDLTESHLYFGAHVLDFIQPELFIQFERRGPTTPPLQLRYSQIDFRLAGERLVLRAGLFLIPFGVFNHELFPRYVVKFSERPHLHLRMVPIQWSEIGVQLRGRWELGAGRALAYQAYVTNGLTETSNAVPRVNNPYDEQIRSVRGAKTFGARVAVEPLEGASVGLSGYHGAVNGVAGAKLIAALDFVFRRGAFSADGELMVGRRLDPMTRAPIRERGFYVEAGYKVIPAVEPVLSVAGVSVSPDPRDNELELWAGVNYFPAVDRFPTTALKVSYGRRFIGDGSFDNVLNAALVLGF